MTLDGIIASEGGIPIMAGGKIVGAIGTSGATGAQDGQASTAGVAAAALGLVVQAEHSAGANLRQSVSLRVTKST